MRLPAVSVIGLGNMGGAIARILAERGHPTTVWNRTANKAEALGSAGAVVAGSSAEALRASPLTIFSLLDYDAVRAVLDGDGAISALAGRTLVNLTSGAPVEAEEMAAFVTGHGAEYIDGNVGCYPEGVGTDEALMTYTGPKDVFDRVRPCLVTIGKDLRHLGESYGAGNALFLAGAAAHTAELLGAFFAAAYGRQHGLGFGEVVSEVMLHSRTSRSYLRSIESRVDAGDYAVSAASVKVYLDALEALAEDMETQAFRNRVFDTMVDVIRDATAAGHAEDEFAVLYKLFSDQSV